jgi:hypothetical protein
MENENLEILYIVENKLVNLIRMAKWQKNAGGKYAGNLHYVIENKWRQNIRNQAFHYVVEK